MDTTRQSPDRAHPETRHPGTTGDEQVKNDKAHNNIPAQGAAHSNTPEQGAQPELNTTAGIKDDNPTTGKGSVEQDDEDVGGDQDMTPDPEIAPVVDKDAGKG